LITSIFQPFYDTFSKFFLERALEPQVVLLGGVPITGSSYKYVTSKGLNSLVQVTSQAEFQVGLCTFGICLALKQQNAISKRPRTMPTSPREKRKLVCGMRWVFGTEMEPKLTAAPKLSKQTNRVFCQLKILTVGLEMHLAYSFYTLNKLETYSKQKYYKKILLNLTF